MPQSPAPMSEWACQIAQAIARVLEARDISDRELARRIGRSQNYVSIRMRCESPLSLADLDAIGNALDLDPASLLAGVPRTRVSPTVPTLGDDIDDLGAAVHPRDLGPKKAYDRAAKRGTRAADQQPHAE
ncbi:helix-turn-helix transcriptional regulator [Agrococcus sp. Marseille-Q4369]|uniref:helix-turn-helix domain-containing protein n=1 Tax=Agrococcus sp. Marseille-Q4369 TaxID=2810513 RepID=UPI001B8C9F4C|nr:helix-turn-helix transcriptional regulator [Agrococcus sp. Marseille-Q4369]QUW18856.1 helix-turn-helix transcriptional regulator [Agrococcus sp. Marseille-Q4369]